MENNYLNFKNSWIFLLEIIRVNLWNQIESNLQNVCHSPVDNVKLHSTGKFHEDCNFFLYFFRRIFIKDENNIMNFYILNHLYVKKEIINFQNWREWKLLFLKGVIAIENIKAVIIENECRYESINNFMASSVLK